MLTYEEAKTRAATFLEGRLADVCPDVTVIRKASTSHDDAFLFAYNSARAIAGDPDHELMGNFPVLVDRKSGEVRYSSPADIIRLRPEQAEELGYTRLPERFLCACGHSRPVAPG